MWQTTIGEVLVLGPAFQDFTCYLAYTCSIGLGGFNVSENSSLDVVYSFRSCGISGTALTFQNFSLPIAPVLSLVERFDI